MIRFAVTVSLVPQARGGPFVYWDDLPAACAKARQLGFHAIELFAPGPDAVDRATLRQILDDHALSLAAIGTGAGWVLKRLSLTAGEEVQRQRAIDFVRRIIDFGAMFSAPAIIGSMQGRSDHEVDYTTAVGYLGQALHELGRHAEQYEIPLLYEPLNRYETDLINRTSDACDLLESIDSNNVKILADLFHMNIEEVDIATALRTAGKRLGHLHFVDSNRRAAGMGHINYPPIVAALKDIGYSGYISAEALAAPTSDDAAAQTIKTYRDLFK